MRNPECPGVWPGNQTGEIPCYVVLAKETDIACISIQRLTGQPEITLSALIRHFELFIIPPVFRFAIMHKELRMFKDRPSFGIKQAANVIRMAVR
jgi:hypothetical protein